MTADQLADLIRLHIARDLYMKPGAVLSSDISTLRPGAIYVMGLNPGGDPQQIPAPMIEMIAPSDGSSAYTHDCWQSDCSDPQPCRHLDGNSRVMPQYLVRHQRNMIKMHSVVDSTPTETFSANAVFARSTRLSTLRTQTGVGLWDWWKTCWPVHKEFLSIVQPTLLITLGYGETSSAFGLLRSVAGRPTPERVGEHSRVGGWTFAAQFNLACGPLATKVVGVPHPSYFAPGPQLCDWLQRAATQANGEF